MCLVNLRSQAPCLLLLGIECRPLQRVIVLPHSPLVGRQFIFKRGIFCVQGMCSTQSILTKCTTHSKHIVTMAIALWGGNLACQGLAAPLLPRPGGPLGTRSP